MTCDVGAVAIVYQEQRQSSIEMIKSFRKHNCDSTIILCTDGVVDDIETICKEYSCSAVINHNKLGYPASQNIEIPLEYFRRILVASQQIPFYFKSRYGDTEYMEKLVDLKLSDRIFHRYKNFYQ